MNNPRKTADRGDSGGVKTWSTPVTGEEKRPVPCALCGGGAFVPHFSGGGFTYVRCVTCGLVQINPQPLPAAVRARYNRTGAPPADGGTAPGREEDYLAYEQAHEGPFLRLQEQALGDAGFFELEGRIMAAARDGGPPADPDRPPMPDRPAALDIGCATGAMLTLLKSRGWDARGVEISRPQAAYCRSRGLDAAALPLEECRFPAGRFDAVLASHVIEHVNDPASFVREARRILKPRGRFYVTTPNIAGLQARLFGGRWRSAIFDHLYLFSVRTLGALLKKEGFTVERVRTWGGLAAGIGPGPVKRVLDSLAKPLGFGDVMIVRAVRD